MARARRHAIALTIPLLATLLGSAAGPVAATDPTSFVTVEREYQPGMTFHRAFVSGTAAIGGGASAGTVGIHVHDLAGSSADISMQAPSGQDLAAGVYGDVLASPTVDHPGLDVVVDQQSCSITSGSFEVLEAPVFAGDGTLESFAATFTQDCGGLKTTGIVSINATTPLAAIVADPTGQIVLPDAIVGIPGVPQVLTLSNPGTAAAHIASITVAGAQPNSFQVDHDCLAIAAGSSCPVSITFRPAAGGQNAADLIMTSNLWANPRTFKLSGHASFAAATNGTAASAKVIASLPYLDGADVSAVVGTGNQCGGEVQSVWYRYTTPNLRRVTLDTQGSTTATNIALFKGSPSASTFVTCGADVAGTGQDGLTFTAEPTVPYFINVVREYPGDFGIVLKATEGPADVAVNAGPFSLQYGTFYPYPDKYRDSLAIRGTRAEKASVAISIYNATGTRVRMLSVAAASGAYAVVWNGKSSAGHAVAGGRYRIVQRVSDAWGNTLTDTRYVTLSKKRLYRHTYTKTLDADSYVARGVRGTGSISKAASRYTGGAKLRAGSNGIAGIAYAFTVPKAGVYLSIRFSVLGTAPVPPSAIGLQDWTRCARYNDSCVDPWGDGPIGGWARIRGSPASNLSSTRHARGYVEVASGNAPNQWVDLRDVRLDVVWGVLK